MNQKSDVVTFNIRLLRLRGRESIGEVIIVGIPGPVIGRDHAGVD